MKSSILKKMNGGDIAFRILSLGEKNRLKDEWENMSSQQLEFYET